MNVNFKGFSGGGQRVKEGPHKGKTAGAISGEIERLRAERLGLEGQLIFGMKPGQGWGDNLPRKVADALEWRCAVLWFELESLAAAYKTLTGKNHDWKGETSGGANDGGGMASYYLTEGDGVEFGDEVENDSGECDAQTMADFFDFAKAATDTRRKKKILSVGEVIKSLHRVNRGGIFSLEKVACKKCEFDFEGVVISPRYKDGTTKKFAPEFCHDCDRLLRVEERRCKKCGQPSVYSGAAPIPAGDGSKKILFKEVRICEKCQPEGKKKEVSAIWATQHRRDFFNSLPATMQSNKRNLFPDIEGSDAAVSHDFFGRPCVLIFGKSRTGKSRTVAEILAKVVESGKAAEWVSCDSLSPKLYGNAKEREAEILRLQSAYCVGFDGFDDVLTTSHVADAYRRIFRARKVHALPTVITTNSTPKKFLEYATERNFPTYGRESVAEILDTLREDFTRYELRTERERNANATNADAWR